MSRRDQIAAAPVEMLAEYGRFGGWLTCSRRCCGEWIECELTQQEFDGWLNQ